MKGHAQHDIDERVRSFEELKQEIQGRVPKGPFEFSADLTFSDIAVEDTDPAVVARFKRATKRDARYSSAGGVYIRAFGFSQSLRSLYDGGKQIIEGGGE
jgi:hypothetical protein